MRRFRGPLAESYWAAAALVVCALVPYLALTAAFTPLVPVLGKSLHLSKQSLELTSGMSNAAYAVGTVLAVQFAQHIRQRRMLLLYASLFLAAAVVAAAAATPAMFIGGYVVMGLCTSLMLIGAVPPLVTGWPTSRMPWTGAIMNMCIFGAVAGGPSFGGIQASAMHWRPLFWIVAGLGATALLLVILTYEDAEPQDPSAPWDWVAIALAACGCGSAFFGASELTTHPFLTTMTAFPLLAGVSLIIVLIVYQAVIRRPLMPISQMLTTKPVAGIVIALTAAAASVAAIDLIETAMQAHTSVLHLADLMWPQLGGAVATAAVFGAVFRRRWIALLPFVGMILIAGGIAVVTGVASGSGALVVIGSALLGLGVGSSVSPALFVAGFSLASQQIQRVFALIELLRAVAAFMAAPIILHIAETTNGGPSGGGIATGLWICFGIAAAGIAISLYLWVLGRARLEDPDLERWTQGEEAAWDTPRLAAGIRRPRTADDLPPWLGPDGDDGAGRVAGVAHDATDGNRGPDGRAVPR